MSAGGLLAFVGWIKPQVGEQHIGELLGRVEVERLADGFKNPLFNFCHAQSQFLRHFLEEGQVEQNARHFHFSQHRHERHFDFSQ